MSLALVEPEPETAPAASRPTAEYGYVYAGDDPVNLVDPTGALPCCLAGAAGCVLAHHSKKVKKVIHGVVRSYKGGVHYSRRFGEAGTFYGSLGGCVVGSSVADDPSGCGPGASLGALLGGGAGIAAGWQYGLWHGSSSW